jgi:hypothetical protein
MHLSSGGHGSTQRRDNRSLVLSQSSCMANHVRLQLSHGLGQQSLREVCALQVAGDGCLIPSRSRFDGGPAAALVTTINVVTAAQMLVLLNMLCVLVTDRMCSCGAQRVAGPHHAARWKGTRSHV